MEGGKKGFRSPRTLGATHTRTTPPTLAIRMHRLVADRYTRRQSYTLHRCTVSHAISTRGFFAGGPSTGDGPRVRVNPETTPPKAVPSPTQHASSPARVRGT